MANRPMFAMLAALAMVAMATPSFADPFKIGVQQNVQNATPGYSEYPAPQMIPQAVKQAPIKKAPPKKPLKAQIEQQQQPQRPMQAQIQQEAPQQPMQARASQDAPPPGVLPPQFMGNWLVLGQRSNIQARPEYQNGIDNIFTSSNSQTWNIVGGPGGYSMSSTSGVQSVQVGQCTSSTAFVRYAHPVGNTVAQEAIVMQIAPDGRTFQGMQRITIRKQGEPAPRAQVTYQLMGRRQ
jgi:outer membrane biosynthesis protein TonB